jgi:hypothetical protein
MLAVVVGRKMPLREQSKKYYRTRKWLKFNIRKWDSARKRGDAKEAQRRYRIWVSILSRRYQGN